MIRTAIPGKRCVGLRHGAAVGHARGVGRENRIKDMRDDLDVNSSQMV